MSAREQRTLGEIERSLTASEPLRGRALASMRPGARTSGGAAATASQHWVIAMITGLLAGIALLSAGLVLDVLPLVFAGAALSQLSLVAGYLPRALSALSAWAEASRSPPRARARLLARRDGGGCGAAPG